MRIAAILPARGRLPQTQALIPRLVATAGISLELIVVVDGEPALAAALAQTCQEAGATLLEHPERRGYWQALRTGATATDAPLLVNLANDLLPGLHWAARALKAYRARFGSDPALVGFNDGIHTGAHAAHMLVHRALLEGWYGPDLWPLHYAHEYGDTELSQRAISEGRFAVAPFALLYHNHQFVGAQMDTTYQEGWATRQQDRALFERRKAAGWAL